MRANALGSLQRLYRLGRRLRRARRGRRQRGRGVEFAGRRPYVSGDDPRRIDWTVYLRLERLVVRLVEELPEPVLSLVLDGSGSMTCGDPSLFEASRRLAAAVGAFSMGRGATVRLLTGTGLDSGANFRGEAQLVSLLDACLGLPGRPGDDLSGAVARLAGQRHRQVVVLGDGLSPGLVDRLAELRHAGHDPYYLLVHPPREWAMQLQDLALRAGRVVFVDAETGERREEVSGAELWAQASAARERALTELIESLDRARLAWAQAGAGAELEEVIRGILGEAFTAAPRARGLRSLGESFC